MNKVISFKTDLSNLSLPDLFTFPFYYDPHPLAKLAMLELQNYLIHQKDFDHTFGLNEENEKLPIGKMFGVLVVQKPDKTLGYLAAFSGKLANSNHHTLFVPPVFDILENQGFYKKEEQNLNELNKKIENLFHADSYIELLKQKENQILLHQVEIGLLKKRIKENKKQRDEKRKEIELRQLKIVEKIPILNTLNDESKVEQLKLKNCKKIFNQNILSINKAIEKWEQKIEKFKKLRAEKSMILQKKIFQHYTFKNALLEEKNILDVFIDYKNEYPPAGAGECAAPKLLQYAYINNLKPICLAEFWWGKSPLSEVRKHGQFYPACKSKCEPILSFMLKGLQVDKNPMIENENQEIRLEILFEDKYLFVINKPQDCLSVPGKSSKNSIYQQIKNNFPKWTGPLLVHRLDYSTSGILLIAKDLETYKRLQKQFIKRSINKKYDAIIDGVLVKKKGIISLPLRVDLDDRPRQVVCETYGKTAITEYEVLNEKENKSHVKFYPITGRTHQLRVHSAHSLGLNTAILGDDLYGKKAERLYLHASEITFFHPYSNERTTIVSVPKFDL